MSARTEYVPSGKNTTKTACTDTGDMHTCTHAHTLARTHANQSMSEVKKASVGSDGAHTTLSRLYPILVLPEHCRGC